MDFKDLHVISEMFAEFSGDGRLEERLFEVHLWRLRQRRRGQDIKPKRTREYWLAYQREWQKRRRSTEHGRAAKQSANTCQYQKLKSDPEKWKRRLAKIAAWKANKRRERKLQRRTCEQ